MIGARARVDQLGACHVLPIWRASSKGVRYETLKDTAGRLCLPPAFTSEDARSVFTRTIRALKESPEQPADAAVFASLALAFPCKKAD